MFEKKENFFKENKIFIAIIIGAIIIGGAIYFSGYKEKDSKNCAASIKNCRSRGQS